MSNDPTQSSAAPGSVTSRPFQPVVAPAKFPPIYANFVSISGAPEAFPAAGERVGASGSWV